MDTAHSIHPVDLDFFLEGSKVPVFSVPLSSKVSIPRQGEIIALPHVQEKRKTVSDLFRVMEVRHKYFATQKDAEYKYYVSIYCRAMSLDNSSSQLLS